MATTVDNFDYSYNILLGVQASDPTQYSFRVRHDDDLPQQTVMEVFWPGDLFLKGNLANIDTFHADYGYFRKDEPSGITFFNESTSINPAITEFANLNGTRFRVNDTNSKPPKGATRPPSFQLLGTQPSINGVFFEDSDNALAIEEGKDVVLNAASSFLTGMRVEAGSGELSWYLNGVRTLYLDNVHYEPKTAQKENNVTTFYASRPQSFHVPRDLIVKNGNLKYHPENFISFNGTNWDYTLKSNVWSVNEGVEFHVNSTVLYTHVFSCVGNLHRVNEIEIDDLGGTLRLGIKPDKRVLFNTSGKDTYFKYNSAAAHLELWVNGTLERTWT